MADSQTNINLNIDTSQALANLKALQSQISAFQTSMARGSATQAANAAKLRQNLINDINATKKFAAGIENIKTTTESFTTALEKNKLSMGEYFRYAGGATKNFGKLFKSEMATIDKVARERVKTLQTQYVQLGRDASGAMKAIAVRPLVLDMEDLGTKTAIAAQKQQILNQLLKQGSTNLLNWGKNTQWAGRQLMVGFTVPLTMAGTAAAKMYMELEKASIKFKRVYGDFNTTAKETETMAKNLQFLAQEYTKYGVAVADTMNMAAEAAAAGKVGADLMEQVANATRLSVLGAVEQSQALETTMSLTNAFGLAAEDLSGKINFLNAVENQTVTSIEDLTIAIPKAAPVIKQLGGNVEDLAFFLTAMKEGGINASEGANALKSGIASMINPTAKASEFLQGFGINLKGIVEANKGDIKGTILQFAQALNTLDPLNRAQAIEQLFGKFQFARLSTLFQNVTKEGTQAQKVLELSNATTEELAILSERELKRVESSPMFKFQKAVEDIKVKLVPIGEAFIKAITPVLDFVGKFLDGFNKMSDGAKSFWITLTGLVAGIGPLLLMTVGLVGNGVANLVKMFVGIKSFINRTTQETGFLGESTSYMTQEQIKAASVAASLDQIHQQLTQRFTSEAAAVDQLTAAYSRNIQAQGAFGPAGTMPTTVGKKYAEGGIISGPGTGTSDSIVARVSNGEAIIPAKSVAKNPDLVRGLISGNIPGFSEGFDPTGLVISAMSKYKGSKPEVFKMVIEREIADILANTVGEVQKTTLEQLQKYVDTSASVQAKSMKAFMSRNEDTQQNLRQNYNEKSRRQGNTAFAHVEDSKQTTAEELLASGARLAPGDRDRLTRLAAANPGFKVNVASGLGFTQSAALNSQMAKTGKADVGEFLADFKSTGIDKWKKSLGFAGLKMEDVASELTIYDNAIAEGVAEFQRMSGSTEITQTQFAQIEQDVRTRLAPQIPTISQAFGELANTIHEVRYSISEQEGLAANLPPQRFRPKGRNAGVTFDQVNATDRTSAAKTAESYLAEEKAVLDKPQNDAYVQTRDRNSPHRLAGEDGKDDAKAYKQGFESIPGVEKPVEQQTKPGIIQRVKRKVITTAAGQIGKMYGSEYLGPVGGKAVGDLASRTTGKIMDSSYAGLEKLKAKVSSVGQNIVDRWNQSIDDEIAAKNKVHAARVQLSDQMLLATDEEYLALTTQQEIYQQKIQNTQHATEAEMQEALARNQILENKRNLLIKEMEENGTDSKVIQERIRLAEQRGIAIDAEQLNNANAAAGNRGTAGKRGNFANKASAFMMTASMVSGALSMVGGEIGKLAQQVTPLIGGMSMLMMVLQQVNSRFTGLAVVGVAAIAGVVYSIIEYNNKISAGIDSVLEFNDAIGTGAKAIQGLADFAGKVSASEVLDKRRQTQLNPYGVVSGKTTFGENFVDSETGTSLIKAAGQASPVLGAAGTNSALVSQLATAVLSNAITPQQARSIAINIGRKMGNVNLGIKIAGELSTLIGPNGENILENGLEIRAKLIQESQNQIALTNSALNKNGGRTLGEVGSAVGGTVGGAVAGTLAGGIAAAGITAAVGGPIGWVAGAIMAITAVAGATIGYFQSSAAYAERLGKLAGANVAIQANAINQQKQLLDSLQLDFEKRIATAKAAGDTAEAERLQNQYIQQRQSLLGQNAKTMTQIRDSFANSQYQDQMLSGAEKAVAKKYKDTAMEDIAGAAIANLQTNVGDKTKRYQLEMLLNTTVDPMSMLMLTDLMATDASVIDKAINISTNLTGTGLSDVLGIASLFVDQNGKVKPSLQTNFIAKMSAITDGEKADELMTLYREIGRMSGDKFINVPIAVEYTSKNPDAEKKFTEDIEQIKNLPKGMLTVDIVQKANIMNPKEMEIMRDNAEYFNNIKTREQQQIYLEYVSILSGTVKDDDPGFKAWLAAEGKQYAGQGSYAMVKFIEFLAERATQRVVGDSAFVEPSKPTGNGGGGPAASWLDDIVKNVRDLQELGQKLTVGYDASAKALVKFAKTGKNAVQGLSGLADKLYANGINQGVIEGILGMSPEEWSKYGKMFVDAKGNLTDLTKLISQIKAQQDIELFTQDSKKSVGGVQQREFATRALVKTTQNMALVQALANDETTSALIANGLLGKTLKQQNAMVKNVTKAYLEKLAAERLANGATQNAINDAQTKIDVLEAESNVYQNGLDIISKRAEKINEAYDKQIQALQEVRSVNDEIARQKQGELDIADALSRGDIGAAAKAAQQLRAQQAQAAADAQVKALEDAKKRAVDALTVEINGQRLSRADLEQKMYDINLQVLEIKQKEIVQNEVILAKQKEILNSLVAQTAEQIKKNAEAAKPIVQTITKKINTVTSGSGGGNGGGNGNSGNQNKDDSKGDQSPAVVQPGIAGTQNIPALSSAIAKTTNLNTKFGGRLYDTIQSKSAAGVNARVESLTDRLSAIGVEAQKFGLGTFGVGGQANWEKRGDLTDEQQQRYDKLKSEWDSIQGQIKDTKANAQSDRNALIASLPKTIQDGLAILKSRKENRKQLAEAEKTAKSVFNKTISSQLGFDEKGRAQIDNASEQAIYDKAWNLYLDSGGRDLSLFDSRIAQLERSLNTAGLSKNAVEGLIGKYATGGMVVPRRFVEGGFAVGTDTVPAMLTPGEFIVSQPAVKSFGADNLKAINSGTYGGNSVYNYSVNVSVSNAGANANDIAQTVIAQIKQIDSQRIRSNNL